MRLTKTNKQTRMKSHPPNSFLTVLAALALSTFGLGATTGSFTEAGALHDARRVHTATLLANGKVLEAGGINQTFTTLTNAELFDPVIRTWTPTGAMKAAAKSTPASTFSTSANFSNY